MARSKALYAAVFAVLIMAGPAGAQQLQTFADRPSFEAAAGSGVAVVGFEELADDTTLQTLSYAGVMFRSTEATPQDLKVLGPDALPMPQVHTKALFSNWNHNPLVMEFEPAAACVGLDVLDVPGGEGLVVTVEGPDGAQSFPVSFLSGGPGFIGFVATAGAISRVTVSNPDGQQHFVGVDDVCFGAAAVAGPGIDECLDLLLAAIQAGKADGTIRPAVARSLEAKVRAIKAALDHGRPRAARLCLRALALQIRACRGRRIAPERADQLLDLTRQCIELL
jgi:hypothetical protein